MTANLSKFYADRYRPTLALMIALAATMACSSSRAETSEATAAASTTAKEGGLQEIVVTSRRRVESIQDIPVAVDAISGQTIERYNVTSITSLSSLTPQLSVAETPTGAGAQFTLRGIGSSSTSVGIEQSVAVVVDGVYYSSGRVLEESVSDLDRAEILKGPQALFFGKNATAGVVSLTTADPSQDTDLLVRGGIEAGSDQLYGDIVGSGPITDTLGIRVALHASKLFGGYVDNSAHTESFTTTDVATGNIYQHTSSAAASQSPGDGDLMARTTLKWTPNDRLTMTLKTDIDHYTANNAAWTNTVYRCPNGFSQLDPVTACTRSFDIHQNAFPSDMASQTALFRDNGANFQLYDSWGATGTINYALDWVTLTSINNFQQNQNDFGEDANYQSQLSGPIVFAAERSRWQAISTEERALTKLDGSLNFLAGLLYQNTERNNALLAANVAGLENSAAPDGFRYVGFYNRSATDGETEAVFGQTIWKPIDEVEITGGARYTHETKDSYFRRPYTNPALLAVFPSLNVISDQSFNNVSPEATASYKPTSNLNFYVDFKTGYKSGGFSNSSNLSAFGQPSYLSFRPETAEGWEAGVKSKLLDNRLHVNLGLFRYDYKHLQVDFYDSPTLSFITTNAGSAITKGAESEFEFKPLETSPLTLHGSLNYDMATYQSYLAPCWAGQTIAQGCNLTVFGNAPGQNLSGAPLAVAPKWTGSLGASYDTSLASGIQIGLSVDGRYSGTYLASSFANPASRQPSYVELDAAARFATEDDSWELSIIGRNLTNEFIVNAAIDGTGTGSGTGTKVGVTADQFGFISPPRTVEIQVTWRH